jgi:hypothetical protein
MRLIPLILAALAAVSAPLAAQPSARHGLRLICVEVAPAASRLVVMEKSDEGWQARWRLGVSSAFLSDPLALASRTLALALDPSPPPAAGGFNGPALKVDAPLACTPFAEFQLPDSDHATAVLIANPAAAGGAPYRILVLDTPPGRFGAGQTLIRNLTSQTIGGKLGGKTARLPAGGSLVIEPGVDQPGDMAQITLARQDGERWIPVCDTRWPAKTEYRRFLILLPRADGSVHPFVLPEYPPFR